MQSKGAIERGLGSAFRTRQIAALVFLNLLLIFLGPFIVLKKLHRYARKRHPHELDWRRWALPSLAEAEVPHKRGKRVVLVGPTYGELRLMEVITRKLEELRPDLAVIWCLRDRATIDLVKRTHPERTVVLWPFENVLPVWKWVRHVKPDVLVITEKFWLPNLISVSRLARARIAVVNGRTNRRDRLGDKLKLPYYRWMTNNIDLFCLQSKVFLQRLEGLIPPSSRAIVTGNMKLDLEVAPLDGARREEVANWLSTLGGHPLLAAGSTGPDADEEFVFEAFRIVRERVDCSLLIAPRKTHRAPATAQIAEERGHRVSLRTRPSQARADVYVMDTLGELSHAYQYARAAFVGGTVVSTGHNVMEPVVWGIPVSYGPLRGHFEDLQVLCEAYGVGFRCKTPKELADHWIQALTDANFQSAIRKRSDQLALEKQGATESTLAALLALIDEEPPLRQ